MLACTCMCCSPVDLLTSRVDPQVRVRHLASPAMTSMRPASVCAETPRGIVMPAPVVGAPGRSSGRAPPRRLWTSRPARVRPGGGCKTGTLCQAGANETSVSPKLNRPRGRPSVPDSAPDEVMHNPRADPTAMWSWSGEQLRPARMTRTNREAYIASSSVPRRRLVEWRAHSPPQDMDGGTVEGQGWVLQLGAREFSVQRCCTGFVHCAHVSSVEKPLR